MANYRYLFTPYDTTEILAVLPVRGGTFERLINRPGLFTGGYIDITDAAIGDRCRDLFGDDLGVKIPPRRILIERDGDIWWAGMVWKVVPRSSRGKVRLDLQCATFESFAFRRQIRGDVEYWQEDQVEIMINMWMRMQFDEPKGYLGVFLPYGQLSGVLRDRTEWIESAGKKYGEAFEQLAEVENGFEFTIDTYWLADQGYFRTDLRIGYPRIGQIDAPHVFTKPGNILDYEWPMDRSRGGTSFQARGGTSPQSTAEDAEPILSGVFKADELLAPGVGVGWPLLEHINTAHSSVEDASVLDEYAMADRESLSGGITIPTVTVRLEGSGMTPAHIGDYARFRIVDEWFTEAEVDGRRVPRLDVTRRIIGIEVTPEDVDGQESAKLILEEPTDGSA